MTLRLGRVAMSLGLLVVLAACAAPEPPAPVHTTWPGCHALGAFSRFPPGPSPFWSESGAVPADFHPVAAVLCEVRIPAGKDGAARMGVERRAVAADDLAVLVDHLAVPDRRRPRWDRSDACPAIAWYPPWLFLLDKEGDWIAPRIPVDACGLPLSFGDEDAVPWQLTAWHDTVVCRGDSAERC